MYDWLSTRVRRLYSGILKRTLTDPPTHLAVIQDGNRRYARDRGLDKTAGHARGAETTEDLLHWCDEIGIETLTLYAFSTENFARPDDEVAALFDLITEKLYTFADADLVHDHGVRIRALGAIDRLPTRVQEAVEYAERRTDHHSSFQLNVALAYGGRTELLRSTRRLCRAVAAGELDPDGIDVEAVASRLYREPLSDVDLLVRTGGEERTSNFLPWYASGHEAAVYFSSARWPEFDKREFFAALRAYDAQERSRKRTRAERERAITRARHDGSAGSSTAGRGRGRALRADPDALDTPSEGSPVEGRRSRDPTGD